MDLLLDTVSNVFGGVMFLTLLAALLVISRGGKALQQPITHPIDPITTLDPSLTIQAIDLQLAELDFTLESQARTLETMTPDEKIEEKIVELDRLHRELQTIAVQSASESSMLEIEMAAKNQTVSSQAVLQRQLELLKSQVKEKEVALERIEEKSSRKITFSLLHNTLTQDVVLLLRDGKIYQFQTSPTLEVNFDDMTELRDGVYIPKKAAGRTTTPAVVNDVVKRTVASFPPNRYHVSIFVWDDSFSAFNPLRNALVDAGYQYRTVPCTQDSVLSRGGGDALVQ